MSARTPSGSPLGAGLLVALSSPTSPGRMGSAEEGEELCRGRGRALQRKEKICPEIRKHRGDRRAPEQGGGSHGLLLSTQQPQPLPAAPSLLSSAFGFLLTAASTNISNISAARERLSSGKSRSLS